MTDDADNIPEDRFAMGKEDFTKRAKYSHALHQVVIQALPQIDRHVGCSPFKDQAQAEALAERVGLLAAVMLLPMEERKLAFEELLGHICDDARISVVKGESGADSPQEAMSAFAELLDLIFKHAKAHKDEQDSQDATKH